MQNKTTKKYQILIFFHFRFKKKGLHDTKHLHSKIEKEERKKKDEEKGRETNKIDQKDEENRREKNKID